SPHSHSISTRLPTYESLRQRPPRLRASACTSSNVSFRIDPLPRWLCERRYQFVGGPREVASNKDCEVAHQEGPGRALVHRVERYFLSSASMRWCRACRPKETSWIAPFTKKVGVER